MILSTNLRKLRTKQDKSQQEIADLLNVDRRTYVNWENGSTNVKSDYIPKLAEMFNVDINELFQGSKMKIEIIQKENEESDNSILNGVILVITDKNIVDELLNLVKNKI